MAFCDIFLQDNFFSRPGLCGHVSWLSEIGEHDAGGHWSLRNDVSKSSDFAIIALVSVVPGGQKLSGLHCRIPRYLVLPNLHGLVTVDEYNIGGNTWLDTS